MLAAQHLIDPGTVRPLAGRAFSIERPRERRPPGDAALFAKALVPAAGRGDAVASYRLYLIAAECDSAASPDVVETYRMTRHLLAPDYTAQLARQLEECEGLLMDPALSDRRHWLKLSAVQGSPEAALIYAASIEEVIGGPAQWARHPEQVIAYKRQAMDYLFNGAAQGYVGALSSLSQAYESGFLTPADPVKALAYRWVVQQVDPSPGSEGLAHRLEEGLSVQQRSDARRQAAVIHEECCVNLAGEDR
ncbi:sel1 repeat family protein [Stenotrophomonas panacihumi]|uniref:sel1 repeat family protein n=1 Tax=Stenotrophomonas panacihumi TaxID=676599 RepID=UPI0011B26FD5|nr:sel1 repeat family protein [Stenotrophomonas panacihumi]